MSLKGKIFLRLVVLVFVLVGALSGIYGVCNVRHHREMVKEGAANRARVSATQIERLMLWDDRIAVRRVLDGVVSGEAAVYAFVEKEQRAYVGTFSEGIPRGLLGRKVPAPGVADVWVFRNERGSLLYDVSVVIGDRNATLHVGLSRAAMDRVAGLELINFIGLAAAAFLAGCLLASVITRWTTLEVDRMTVSRDYLRNIIDGFPEMLMVLTPDHRVVLANRLAQKMARGKGADAEALTCYQVSHDRMVPCGDSEHPCPLEQVIRKRVPVTIEHIHRNEQGQEAPFEIVAAPVFNEKGEVIQIIESARDLSERAWLETQLRQSQKMEAIGQLAGGIAHDFNNLLQAIHGYTDLILADTLPDDPHAEDLHEIDSAARRASDLTRQLLAFSRRQVLQLNDLDLNVLISNMVNMLRRLIGEHIDFRFIPGHQLGMVRADSGQIEQVVMNLCINARDAMPKGGELIVESENVLITDDYCSSHPETKKGRYVLLSVTDTGEGMDEKTMARIFEPFFTTKEKGRGTGLGLATVYGIIKQHDGMIQAYSEVNKGTTFKLYFPSVERLATSVASGFSGPVPGGTETILLAEDSESVRKLAKIVLEKAGYTVLAASDGREALRVFAEHRDKVDMLMLDIVMPGLDGQTVYEQIRKHNPHVPVLFATGYNASSIHTSFVLSEGMNLIEKPYQSDALRRKVREVLDGAAESGPAGSEPNNA